MALIYVFKKIFSLIRGFGDEMVKPPNVASEDISM